MDKIVSVVGYSIVGLLVLLFISFFIHDFSNAMTKRYWIDMGGSTYYTDSYREKDGCIYFTSHYNSPIEQCGSYRVNDKSK